MKPWERKRASRRCATRDAWSFRHQGPRPLSRGESLRVPVGDPMAKPALDVVVDHLRKAAEFFFDGLGLLDEHFKYPVLDALWWRGQPDPARGASCRTPLSMVCRSKS